LEENNKENIDRRLNMSGGHFEYKQHHILDIIEQLEDEIKRNDIRGVYEFGYSINSNFSKRTIYVFKETVKKLKEVYEAVRRIDYLLSGDDREETFLENISNNGIAILDYYGFRKKIELNQYSINDGGHIDVVFYKPFSTNECNSTPSNLKFPTVRFYFFGEYEDGKPIFIYK
jgi:hypothetical protein